MSTKHKQSESKSAQQETKMNIQIPSWVSVVDYRTMTNEKKLSATNGNKLCQYEWMKEEVNEFYEAIYLQDIEETRDEAIGLIRTYQHFQGSARVVALWKKVRKDVASVFPTREIFIETFQKWHAKKLKKNQAKDVVYEDLIKIAKLKW
jgi:hypothetical protein